MFKNLVLTIVYDKKTDSYVVKKCEKHATSVIVPAMYKIGSNELKPITKILDNAFEDCKKLRSVKLLGI